MELRRNMWRAAVRLAIAVSVTAVVFATVLSSAGLSQPVIVLGVIVVAFAASWVRSAHVEERTSTLRAHRVATVPVRVVRL